MFHRCRDALKCYVYLADVSIPDGENQTEWTWEAAFRNSLWLTRGWTLQKLLAPASVEFFSREEQRLGSRSTIEQQIHEISYIPIAAFRGTPLSQFSVDERMRWAAKPNTKKKED
ncbi:hypothetical protein AYL99_11740 [Fonsecaea erecta]|uniref:Uncharacterized protein n=1 Tax=Fonsecaea erecta TaxID=1367422 RepID=A0A178Z553_9EURO|nr:hypothetical protein AYL99_11740 [Fonsecaea erecta]OAP54205.1 hypothetical protein AYL99_11740 [Fonsecaea erecta]